MKLTYQKRKMKKMFRQVNIKLFTVAMLYIFISIMGTGFGFSAVALTTEQPTWVTVDDKC